MKALARGEPDVQRPNRAGDPGRALAGDDAHDQRQPDPDRAAEGVAQVGRPDIEGQGTSEDRLRGVRASVSHLSALALDVDGP